MWFEVDKRGLAQLLERKGKAFILYELLQNAWDEETTRVEVTLKRIPHSKKVQLTVEDDNPKGFACLDHAFTLFAASSKKGQAEKRGRFNLGEKLVLALCSEARITSTAGSVIFNEEGRSRGRQKTQAGSIFEGTLTMTEEELQEAEDAVRLLLPPTGITTIYNSHELPVRGALSSLTASLATELADDEGVMRRTQRKTTVEVHEPLEGEVAMLYEMGIPVVETGDRWHLNVQQKVPLNFDRDNVSPAYLSKLRAMAVEHMSAQLTAEDANAAWVRDAMGKHAAELSDETVQNIALLRFGEKRVSYDPSDPEANSLAVSKGYQVVHGSQLGKAEWDAIRRAGAILPAGRVTPSPKPYSDDPDAKVQKLLDPKNYTPGMRDTVNYIRGICKALIDVPVVIEVTSDITWPFRAAYGGCRMVFNLGRLSHAWFDLTNSDRLENINELVIHELGHHYSGDHLSSDYHDGLTRLGAKLTRLALTQPALFNPIHPNHPNHLNHATA